MTSIEINDLESALDAGKSAGKPNGNGGLLIDFEGLSYTVRSKVPTEPENQQKYKEKNILSGISGLFEPGKMTALMGPSGSGKTTLLDVIAGRKTAGKITGRVSYNGEAPTAAVLKQSVGYVEQFDTLVPELTVFQMLMYAAELKLPESLSTANKIARVQTVLQQLSLAECKDTVIGDALRKGISGGQAKRVNIGLSLLTSPSVIFLDEPTTGLDSHMANEVVKILQGLAREGRTICATIHSPTSYAFNLFDSLLMLKQGRVIYDGPLDNDAAHARDFFAAQGFSPPSAETGLFFSSVEWLVEITSGADSILKDKTGGTQKLTIEEYSAAAGSQQEMTKAENNNIDFAAAYASSTLVKRNSEKRAQVKRQHGIGPGDGGASSDGAVGGREVVTSSCHGIATLLKYRTMTHIRSPDFLGPRFGDKIMFSVLILSLYWKIGEQTDAQSIQSTASLLYFIIALCGYGAAAFVPSLTLDRPLFYRERADGYYTTFTYYMAKFIEEAVVAAMTSLLFCLVVFFSCGLQGSFGVFLAVYFLTSMIGIVLAYAVASAVPSMEAANALLPTYVTFCMYFGGLFLIFDKIPQGWKWYSYTDFLRYAWSALMVNQFKHDTRGVNGTNLAVFGGQDVLAFYAITQPDGGVMGEIWFCCLMLVLLVVVFAFLGGLALAKINHSSR